MTIFLGTTSGGLTTFFGTTVGGASPLLSAGGLATLLAGTSAGGLLGGFSNSAGASSFFLNTVPHLKQIAALWGFTVLQEGQFLVLPFLSSSSLASQSSNPTYLGLVFHHLENSSSDAEGPRSGLA